MKISELIEVLEELREEHGDIPVSYKADNFFGYENVESASLFSFETMVILRNG